MCTLEEHFCEGTKNDCALVFPAEAGYSWEGAEIWSSQAGWSKELRPAGLCHVPPRLWVPTVQGTPIVRLQLCFEECESA